MDLGLRSARVLVTGGGSNIGRGVVHGFAAEGSRVLICDIDGEQARRVEAEARDLGAEEAEAFEADLTSEDGPARAVQHLLERWGGIDVLVNNAGWSTPGFLTEQTDRAIWQRTMEINLFTAIGCTQAALGPMQEAKAGSIVFMSSDAGFGAVRQGIYGTTKAGLISLARTVARENGRYGIRSNVVAPGLVIPEDENAVGKNSLWAVGKDANFNQDQIDYMLKQTPLRRLTTAADIANAVLWVSSETAARQVTGQIVAVGGGTLMP